MSAGMNTIPQLAILTMASPPEQPLRTSPQIGSARFAELEKTTSLLQNNQSSQVLK